jgi:hypothetical protein
MSVAINHAQLMTMMNFKTRNCNLHAAPFERAVMIMKAAVAV